VPKVPWTSRCHATDTIDPLCNVSRRQGRGWISRQAQPPTGRYGQVSSIELRAVAHKRTSISDQAAFREGCGEWGADLARHEETSGQ